MLRALAFLICGLLYSQKDTVIYKNGYTVNYSMKFKKPMSVKYQVICNKSGCIRENNFHNEPGVTSFNLEYYKLDGYDRGHLAPFESICCLYGSDTFSYINIVPQNRSLNRGVWKTLEMAERKLYEIGFVVVEIQIDWGKENKIPVGFKKTIYFNGKKRRVYYFKNEKPISNLIVDYEIKE